MDLKIKNKKALVLGGSKGLGLAIAKTLAQEGAQVTIVSRNPEQAQIGDACQTIAADLSNPKAPPDIYAQLQARDFYPDILVCNTGGPAPSTALDQPLDALREGFQSLVLSQVELVQLCAKDMKAKNWGRIISIASSGVVSPLSNLAASNLLRSGLVAWAKTLATELGPYGVTVNTLIPGRIATDRLKSLDAFQAEKENKTAQAVSAAIQQDIPVRRYGRPEEFAAMAAFICSESAAYVTGSAIRIDGGYIPSI